MSVNQIVSVINALFVFYEFLIVIWCLLSWFPIKEGSVVYDIAQAINTVVSPYIDIFRRFIPPISGIDFSPVVAIFALGLIERLVIQLVYYIV